jgi:hypothetical protein
MRGFHGLLAEFSISYANPTLRARNQLSRGQNAQRQNKDDEKKQNNKSKEEKKPL